MKIDFSKCNGEDFIDYTEEDFCESESYTA